MRKMIIAGVAIELILQVVCVAIGLIAGRPMCDIAAACAVLFFASCLGVGLTSVIVTIINWAIE
jgi:hypothetical protein